MWDSQLGWLVGELKKGIIVGEWGGSLVGKDDVVQRELGKYLVENCIASNVWWAINPESTDTGTDGPQADHAPCPNIRLLRWGW